MLTKNSPNNKNKIIRYQINSHKNRSRQALNKKLSKINNHLMGK